MLDWGKDQGQLPGEIWCFVEFADRDEDFGGEFEGSIYSNNTYAVVESSQPCENLTEDHDGLINPGLMFSPFAKEIGKFDADGQVERRKFYLADVDSIVRPLCVIPDVGNEDRARYLVIKPRREWANSLINANTILQQTLLEQV